MHDNFADWYRLATTGADAHFQPDLLDRRWAGVEAAVKAVKTGDEFDLVRLLTGRSPVGKEFVGTFRGAFKAADSTFTMQGNDLELRVLAGSAFAHLTNEESGPTADRAALALACSVGFTSLADRPWLPPFVELAESYLEGRSRDIRRVVRVTWPKFDATAVHTAADTFAKSFAAQDWSGNIPTTAKAAFVALTDAVAKFTKASATTINNLAWQDERRREESDVLWWLTAEYSRDFGQRMADVKLPAAAVVTGKELADLVSLPGPLSANSFLDKMLSTCGAKGAYRKAVTLAGAVNACSREWRSVVTGLPGLDKTADLCPTLGAIRHSLTTDDDSAWAPAYSKAYGIAPSTEVVPTDLALRVYRECLLTKAAQ
jgi:hypothetical protein